MATLELPGGAKVENPTPDDIARALEQPRDDDWYINLARGDDDYLDAMIEDGALWVECEEGGKFQQAQSHVDDANLKAMMVDFAAGGAAWRDMALWAEPAPQSKKGGRIPVPVIAAGVAGVIVLVALVLVGRSILPVLFALAFPGLIAVAAFTKLQEVKRAAGWTKASNGKITRSELVTKKVNDKEVEVPHVEYEFTVGMNFNKVLGNRISLGESEGPHGAKEVLARYRVGAAVPVYYNPDNPRESVLDRDLPQHFQLVWVLVAVLTAVILAVAYWFLWR